MSLGGPYQWSDSSHAKLMQCDGRIQKVFNEAIKHINITILEGERSKERQNKLYEEGKTQVKWPNSMHNTKRPNESSKAIDWAPYPIDWNDTDRFYYFAGIIMGIASQMNVNLRYGGDWDGDTQVKDETFKDLGHMELENPDDY